MIRIGVIGPVEPFRSGVARHTTALARALSKRPDTAVRVFSFSRQYPALLFPGESDRLEPPLVPADLDVRYVLDSIDPLSWWRTARELREFRPDVVMAPAWTFFVAPCLTYLLRDSTQRGVPTVLVVHNLADHDMRGWKPLLIALQVRQGTAWLTHTEQLAASIRRVVPGARVEVCAHPTFDYPAPRGTLPKRAELELLMFGLLRPYKGLDVLLRALALRQKRSVMLSVVGEAWQDLKEIQMLIDRLQLRERVEMVPRHVSDAEAAEYFGRTDVVVLPYRSVTGSGVLPLAFHYGKPALISRLPGLSEFVEEGRTGWTATPGDPVDFARLIDTELSREAALGMVADLDRARQHLSFDRFADAALQAANLRVSSLSSSTSS